MTDEKLAEEWVKENFNLYIPQERAVKQAYIAGFKAGKENAKKEIEEELLKCYQGYRSNYV